jgi:hypothetical protein
VSMTTTKDKYKFIVTAKFEFRPSAPSLVTKFLVTWWQTYYLC